ncbi:hypothetical protein AMAG_02728 [Allomyces macrogynus ATCC 38327]|uniref:NmrA-like domain-containing protein n=1 Tax=Allomyces macrogynus (strain ATCC 38327) TaxID=578462 RepID=A0A0L0S354_ALLM3|nr:hypothetical protein AMAG_02728 [Allomyces macrogynus ATCC 38327]|eukprot:KNE56962.1 hypothetical protein AMAG_02728 [Allomyces macrogynus ATCC 38327]
MAWPRTRRAARSTFRTAAVTVLLLVGTAVVALVNASPTMTTAMPNANAAPVPILITNADKLLGYVAAKDFLAHFGASAFPTVLRTDDEQHVLDTEAAAKVPIYQVHCTVSDETSAYAALVRDLGCTTHQIEPKATSSELAQAWSTVLSAIPHLRGIVYVPDVGPDAGKQARVALAAAANRAIAPDLHHVVVWSRHGTGGAGTADLKAFQWYAAVERAARLTLRGDQAPSFTLLRLSFALERFLDMAIDIQDYGALRLPLGEDGGILSPISLHDATWASHNLFEAAESGAVTKEPFKQVMTLTLDYHVTARDLAASASEALELDVGYIPVSREEAVDIFSSLENFTPRLVTTMLDVLECATRGPEAECNTLAPVEDVQALLPGRKVKPPVWFWKKYANLFEPGGGE